MYPAKVELYKLNEGNTNEGHWVPIADIRVGDFVMAALPSKGVLTWDICDVEPVGSLYEGITRYHMGADPYLVLLKTPYDIPGLGVVEDDYGMQFPDQHCWQPGTRLPRVDVDAGRCTPKLNYELSDPYNTHEVWEGYSISLATTSFMVVKYGDAVTIVATE